MAKMVGFDEPLRVDLHLRLVEAGDGRIRPAANRHQHVVVGGCLRRTLALEEHRDGVFRRLHRRHLGREHHLVVNLLDALRQDLHQVAIGAGQQSRRHLDHRHLGAERRVDRTQFQTDVATTDDEHRLWDLRQIERGGGIEQARRVNGQRRDLGRRRAGRHNQVVDGDGLFPAICLLHADRLGVNDRRPALEVIDLAELRHLAGAAGQLLDDAVLIVPNLVDVDFRSGKLDAPVLRVLRFIEDLGHMQQGLGRNAAAVQAHAARVLLVVDECDLQPEVSRVKRGRVAAGPGANDCNVMRHD